MASETEIENPVSPKPGSQVEGSEVGNEDADLENGSNLGDGNDLLEKDEEEEGTELNNDVQAFKEEINKLVVDAPSMFR